MFLFGIFINIYSEQGYKYCVLSLIQIFKTNSVVQFPAWDLLLGPHVNSSVSSVISERRMISPRSTDLRKNQHSL